LSVYLPPNERHPPSAYHWSPGAQRRFLAVLAETGSIGRACAAVSKSREAAYALRRRSRGRGFATGWDAALIAFRDGHADAMMGHALEPIAYDGVRHPETRRLMWRRADPRLGRGMGMTLLLRLDRAVAPILADPARAARAYAALENFEAFLDAVAASAGEAGVQPFYCQLARNSGNIAAPARAGWPAGPPHLSFLPAAR
jgi:hypothetical protein